jgi:hypothetical protein
MRRKINTVSACPWCGALILSSSLDDLHEGDLIPEMVYTCTCRVEILAASGRSLFPYMPAPQAPYIHFSPFYLPEVTYMGSSVNTDSRQELG